MEWMEPFLENLYHDGSQKNYGAVGYAE